MGLAETAFRLFTTGHARWYRMMKGRLAGKNVLLLTTIGRKTGKTRVSPLLGLKDGDNYLVAGSVGGAPRHPGWYYNLKANPEIRVQVGATVECRIASIAEGEERDQLYQKFIDANRQFAVYQDRTERTIPVVVLEPTGLNVI
jgi:deazaflavin-dependent oxidoreductase (nitroreductase family)